jgi:hypothetical protein
VIAEKTGDLSEPYSRIKDTCNFPRKILDLIIFLENQEDAKRITSFWHCPRAQGAQTVHASRSGHDGRR